MTIAQSDLYDFSEITQLGIEDCQKKVGQFSTILDNIDLVELNKVS